MLRLRTFGGLSLWRGDDNLTGALTQRRRLAILALLAVAGDAGLSRDKVMSYLWPESDLARARHVLNQLLYAQRRQVGDSQLFVGGKTLRLNPDLIASDVSAFELACAQGDRQSAVGLYAGPFLDGFFVKDAPEFERWVEDQRARLARRALEALTALAAAADRSGHRPGAIGWWRRAAELDPFALAAAGDRPAALREAARHQVRLEAELGVAPDPRFRQTVEQIRGAPSPP
jgi:DNA-binding SARP family transcriptional activator